MKCAFGCSDDKNPSDLCQVVVEPRACWTRAVQTHLVFKFFFTFAAFENSAQFCIISPLICQVSSKGILQIPLDLELCSPKGAS